MNKSAAISVGNLGKEYVLGGAEKADISFREMLTDSLAAPFRRLRRLQGGASDTESFWALKDVSFEVRPGEVVGIIGRNGAGKSTLLKILSRITDPTEGRVEIRGRVSSLLEVGTGFHPELTGRENIFLNGAILGMTHREIRSKFDEIVAFSEVEKFLDTPVKRYSSGMYVRLAFAVAAHLEPEILVVDEVLAVGDAAFQKKCLGKMQDVGKEGRTVLFVSHNMAAIKALCMRAICLQQGRVAVNGAVEAVIEHYLETDSPNTDVYEAKQASPKPYIRRIRIFQEGSGGRVVIDKPVTIVFDVESHDMRELEVGLLINNSGGVCVHHSCSAFSGEDADQHMSTVECIIPPYGLGPGKHSLDVVLHKRKYEVFEHIEHALGIEVAFTGILSDKTVASAWKGACGPGLLQWRLLEKDGV